MKDELEDVGELEVALDADEDIVLPDVKMIKSFVTKLEEM